ncbi:MAG: hypothetical protein OHK0021_12750 [Bryobacter sp.]
MKYPHWARVVAFLLVVWAAPAGELRLRQRTIDTAVEAGNLGRFSSKQALSRRLSSGRVHWLVEAEEAFGKLQAALAQRGATVLAQLPVNGYVLVTPEDMNWDALPIRWRSVIEAADKVSPQLLAVANDLANTGAEASLGEEEAPAPSPTTLLLVRFHGDIAAWEADGILEAEGQPSLTHAALANEDRLLTVPTGQLRAVAERMALWDEVEYVFLAPSDFLAGETWYLCHGENTTETIPGFVSEEQAVHAAHPHISLLAAPLGEGWDGAGRGSAALTYSFGPMPANLDAGQTRAEASRALTAWANAIALSWRETTTRTAARNVDIFFATGEHGDPYPFLAGSRTLAHAFYPAPPNPEPLAGDIHVNSAYAWSFGGTWDVFSVVLHEAGHALGLGHSDAPGAVMYPYYKTVSGLAADDVASVQQIYAAAGETPPASPEPTPSPAPNHMSLAITAPADGLSTTASTVNFSGTLSNAPVGVRLTYRNAAGNRSGNCLVNSIRTIWSCAGIPLSEGDNLVSIVAIANAGTANEQIAEARRTVRRPVAAAVTVLVSSPSAPRLESTAASFRITGSAQHNSGIARVEWSTSRGRSGTASLNLPNAASVTFSASVPLELGENTITLRALARTGQSATTTRVIVRKQPGTAPPPDPTQDKEAPKMTVQAPIGTFIFTSAPRMTFRGTATDNVGVRRVSWRNTAGAQSGEALLQQSNGQVQWSFEVNLQSGFNAIEIRAWDEAGNACGYTATVRRY